MNRFPLLVLFAVVSMCSPALAATPASVVPPTDLQSTKISYRLGSVTKKKTVFCLQKSPGDAKAVTGGMLFTPYATTLSQLKAKKITGAKLTTYTQLASVGKKTCSKLLRSGPQPTPTPTPGSGGTGKFDMAGNVTEAGKLAFGIPSNLTGNISAGKSLTQSYCSCHMERLGRSFPSLRSATSQSPMFFDSNQLPDSALANITAYLNRFTP